MNQKYGFKKHNSLDRRQFNQIMWNLVKQMSNNAEHSLSPSSSCCKETK